MWHVCVRVRVSVYVYVCVYVRLCAFVFLIALSISNEIFDDLETRMLVLVRVNLAT